LKSHSPILVVAAVAMALSTIPAPVATASIAPLPIKSRMLVPARAALPGQTFDGTVSITAAVSGTITGVRFQGEGWSILGVDPPAPVSISEGDTIEIHFQGIPSGSPTPLTLSLDFGGETYESFIDVSPASVAWATTPPLMVPFTPSVGDSEGLELPAPYRTPESETPSPSVSGTKTTTVKGRLVCPRPDGKVVGGYGVYYEIRDQDLLWDDVLASGYTDKDGAFSASFNWNNCWLCDTPDLYVYFETYNGHVEVEDAVFEINYRWRTAVKNNYSSSTLDLNTITPPSSERPALYIYTNLMHAWDWVKNNENLAIPDVDVQWPAKMGTTYYNPVFEEIHILPEDNWVEVTHLHEYGHHWHENFGDFSIPTYFDPHGGLFGHCMWCSENELAAWEEGWAEYFSDRIVKMLPGIYLVPLMKGDDDAEWTKLCQGSCTGADNVLNTPSKTEGFIAAVLRDIDDAVNEKDLVSGGPAWQDALSLGTDEIFKVADLDAPTSVWGFFNAFKVRFPQHTANLWETARNNGFQLDALPPGSPLLLSLQFPPVVCWNGGYPVRVLWTTPTDDWSGVAGYSVSITGAPQTPDMTKDIGAVNQYNTSCLAGGDYVFNIRAVDRAGRWSTSYASIAFSVKGTSGSGGTPGVIQAALDVTGTPISSGHAVVLFTTAGSSRVNLTILDVMGRRVRTLADGVFAPGSHRFEWDATDDDRRPVAKGIYFVRRTGEEPTVSKRIVVLK
jgi:hypothetical protein